ncbi:MAG: replication-associated recombination protein A [Clostridia bacterium]|nr:replication-associated recombination protein A [Clostridia bacterium]
MAEKTPLAYRMAPETIDEYVGQEHILGKDKMLYRLVKADRLSSIILWGPPGCGKTSLARVIANSTEKKFEKLNAVAAGVSDIKRIVDESKNPLMNPSGKVVLFIDEIHRFNKLQQDALLPYVEDGTVILIGATTENPYFSVNKALISRSTVFKLQPLTNENVFQVLKTAVLDTKKGLGNLGVKVEDDVLKMIAELSNGDVRVALNALEIGALTTDMNADGDIEITKDIALECIQKKKVEFDKTGDSHYDNISAFIKSMRGSDPDATLFYLARAIYAGEDPMFLARRIIISASEDVGMANSNALVVATAALQAVHQVGMPEARIILAHAATYIARSPKSNAAYLGINKALDDVENKDTGTIPMHIRNAPVEAMQSEGYGVGYKYPHDYPNHEVEQQYLPDKMLGTKYYTPDETEEKIKRNNA